MWIAKLKQLDFQQYTIIFEHQSYFHKFPTFEFLHIIEPKLAYHQLLLLVRIR